MGLGGSIGTSSPGKGGCLVCAVPSPVPCGEVERVVVLPLLFLTFAAGEDALGVELKKANQSVMSATPPSAIAAIIFFRSDLGFSSGEAISPLLKNC
jgi:hypothetical protein